MSGTIILKYQEYSSQKALQVVEEMLQIGENFLNEINRQIMEKEINFYENELTKILTEISKLKTFLSEKQIESSQISPSKTFEAMSDSILKVEAELLQEKANLSSLLSYLSPSALQVQTAKSKIVNIEKQISKFKKELATKEKRDNEGDNSSTLLNVTEMQLMLVMEKYKLTLESLEKSKFEAMHRAKHMVLVSKPFKPQEAHCPRRVINIIIFSLLYFMIIFIISVVVEIIKEHKI
jgi:capsular polysaccharide transport system permease protein